MITNGLGGQTVDSTKIETYIGFDFISGPELVAKFRHQLIHSHYIDHQLGEVEGRTLYDILRRGECVRTNSAQRRGVHR